MEFVEVRVPTFRRPGLLRRALLSLRSQSYSQWRALVFDDSPGLEAEDVVRALGDSRILYRANSRKLGACGNISQCFRTRPYAGGDYVFVLEDDNYLLPEYIERNIVCLETHSVAVVLRNQLIEEVREYGVAGSLAGRTTLGDLYREGLYRPLEFKISLLFAIGVSNGGLFWRASANTDFAVGDVTWNAVVQEKVRTFRLRDPLYFAAEPLAVWRANAGETCRAPLLHGQVARWQSNLKRKRTVQEMRRHVLREIAAEGQLDYLMEPRFRVPQALIEQGVRTSCERWPAMSTLTKPQRFKFRLLGWLLRLCVRPAAI